MMDRQTSGGAELLWTDFCSCAYEVSGSEVPGGLYVFNRYHSSQYHIASPLPETLHKKLEDVFRQCVVYYMPFVHNPQGFLQGVRHTLLWDERSGRYAVVFGHRGDGPDEKMFVWLRLEPNGYGGGRHCER